MFALISYHIFLAITLKLFHNLWYMMFQNRGSLKISQSLMQKHVTLYYNTILYTCYTIHLINSLFKLCFYSSIDHGVGQWSSHQILHWQKAHSLRNMNDKRFYMTSQATTSGKIVWYSLIQLLGVLTTFNCNMIPDILIVILSFFQARNNYGFLLSSSFNHKVIGTLHKTSMLIKDLWTMF